MFFLHLSLICFLVNHFFFRNIISNILSLLKVGLAGLKRPLESWVKKGTAVDTGPFNWVEKRTANTKNLVGLGRLKDVKSATCFCLHEKWTVIDTSKSGKLKAQGLQSQTQFLEALSSLQRKTQTVCVGLEASDLKEPKGLRRLKETSKTKTNQPTFLTSSAPPSFLLWIFWTIFRWRLKKPIK